jgi:hypothetical protein
MTATSPPTVPVQPPETPPPKSRKGIKLTAAVIGALVLLGGGFAAGYASGHSPVPGYEQQLAQGNRNLSAEQLKLSSEKVTLQVEQGNVRTAQANAKNAMATATAQAKAQYKSKLASVQALQQKLQQEQGIVQHNTINSDGVYVVGKDIASGTFHTPGDGGSGDQCYYATLGSTSTSNILDNNNFDGPETVDLSGAYAFEISGGCTWVKVG